MRHKRIALCWADFIRFRQLRQCRPTGIRHRRILKHLEVSDPQPGSPTPAGPDPPLPKGDKIKVSNRISNNRFDPLSVIAVISLSAPIRYIRLVVIQHFRH